MHCSFLFLFFFRQFVTTSEKPTLQPTALANAYHIRCMRGQEATNIGQHQQFNSGSSVCHYQWKPRLVTISSNLGSCPQTNSAGSPASCRIYALPQFSQLMLKLVFDRKTTEEKRCWATLYHQLTMELRVGPVNFFSCCQGLTLTLGTRSRATLPSPPSPGFFSRLSQGTQPLSQHTAKLANTISSPDVLFGS